MAHCRELAHGHLHPIPRRKEEKMDMTGALLFWGSGWELVNKARNLGLNPNKLLHPCLSLLGQWRSVVMVPFPPSF